MWGLPGTDAGLAVPREVFEPHDATAGSRITHLRWSLRIFALPGRPRPVVARLDIPLLAPGRGGSVDARLRLPEVVGRVYELRLVAARPGHSGSVPFRGGEWITTWRDWIYAAPWHLSAVFDGCPPKLDPGSTVSVRLRNTGTVTLVCTGPIAIERYSRSSPGWRRVEFLNTPHLCNAALAPRTVSPWCTIRLDPNLQIGRYRFVVHLLPAYSAESVRDASESGTNDHSASRSLVAIHQFDLEPTY